MTNHEDAIQPPIAHDPTIWSFATIERGGEAFTFSDITVPQLAFFVPHLYDAVRRLAVEEGGKTASKAKAKSGGSKKPTRSQDETKRTTADANIPAHLAAILDDADDVTRRDALNVYDLIQSHDREESIRNFYRRDNDQ